MPDRRQTVQVNWTGNRQSKRAGQETESPSWADLRQAVRGTGQETSRQDGHISCPSLSETGDLCEKRKGNSVKSVSRMAVTRRTS